MTTITITDFISGAHRLKAKEPLVLAVNHHLLSQWPKVEVFGQTASSESIDGLHEAVLDLLDFLWARYALEDDGMLTRKSQTLKRDLLEAFDVTPVS